MEKLTIPCEESGVLELKYMNYGINLQIKPGENIPPIISIKLQKGSDIIIASGTKNAILLSMQKGLKIYFPVQHLDSFITFTHEMFCLLPAGSIDDDEPSSL